MASGNEEKSFFLGISGEPAGPFTLDEVRSKLARGDINRQTLIWYKGLSEWQPIDDITFFQELNPESSISSVTGSTEGAPKTSATRDDFLSPTAYSPADDDVVSQVSEEPVMAKTEERVPTTFAPKGSKPTPVFNKQQAVFNKRSTSPWIKISVGAIAILLVSWGMTAFFSTSTSGPLDGTNASSQDRKLRLETAKENLVLNTALGLAELKRLLAENLKDEVGAQAAQAIELHYWTKKDYKNLGDLMLMMGQPFRAAEFYLQTPPHFDSAVTAYKFAFENSENPEEKKRALLSSIQILLNHLNKKNQAIEQVQLFQRTFPHDPNPYGYYLLSPEQQLVQVFGQVSQEFQAALSSYFEGEFPQLKLIHTPKIEIHKDGNKYRITGTYQGDLKLNQDQLKGVYMHLWFHGDHWSLVETNITPDRKKFAAKNKQELQGKALEVNTLLTYLESIRNQLVRQTAGQPAPAPNLSMKNIPGQ